ncbi:MAG: peroxiredoxin [Phyllobacteriaceae bacterium]|nr:peroxiredoxin [Phyllobacteriaceae bacterium]
MKDPNVLSDGLPVPEDEGAADHLTGMRLPDVRLASTAGDAVDLASLKATVVLYLYPMTGRPGVALPDGWDGIAGARGCTPQSCAFRDHFADLQALGVDRLFGISAQDTDYQREAKDRLHLPFDLLSDVAGALRDALDLPVFAVEGMVLLKRMAIIAREGVIAKVFYPVFPPDRNAADVIDWLSAQRT